MATPEQRARQEIDRLLAAAGWAVQSMAKDDDLRGVNPGEHVHKDHFVIVDCEGVCERDKTDSRPMDPKKSVPLDALLQAVSLGNVEPEVLSSVAVRLARLDAQLTDAERAKVVTEPGGLGLKELSRGIVQALDPRDGHRSAQQRARCTAQLG